MWLPKMEWIVSIVDNGGDDDDDNDNDNDDDDARCGFPRWSGLLVLLDQKNDGKYIAVK